MNEIPKIENRESFFKRFELKITADQMKMLKVAYKMAKYGHLNQIREGGERYFEHPRSAALILIDELGITNVILIMAILLHDLLEDSWLLDEESMTTLFGEEVAAIVSAVTKPRKDDPRFKNAHERHVWYSERLKKSKIDAKLVKLADRLHNMRTLGFCSPEKRARKMKETRDVYFPLIDDIAKVYPEKAEYLRVELEKALAKVGN